MACANAASQKHQLRLPSVFWKRSDQPSRDFKTSAKDHRLMAQELTQSLDVAFNSNLSLVCISLLMKADWMNSPCK